MEISSESPIKRSRLTSVVWNDFERVKTGDVCMAVCKHCKKTLSGSSTSGTSHLKKHLIRCRKRSNHDITQLFAPKVRKKEGALSLSHLKFEDQKNNDMISFGNVKFDHEQRQDESMKIGCCKFDQEQSRLDLVRMIILHGYPLDMVEHIGFKVFVQNLQPLFEIMTVNIVHADCMAIYEKEKQKVYEMLDKLHGRISLTADVWDSSESARYLCLTAHYIDESWRLQKKILNFVMLDPSHTGDVSEVIVACLMVWDIDRKLFSMAFDDCSTNENIVSRIRERLCQSKLLLNNGKLFGVSCASHLLNLIAQDVLEELREVIHKVRESVRYVKSSQAMQETFNEMAQQAQVDSQKSLCLDCPMRWNSTYLMLDAALEYMGAFSLFQQHDSGFTVAPSDIEWERTSSIISFLKLFVEVTNVFMVSRYPTANIYFPEICDIHLQLIEWCKSSDTSISSLALRIKEKFDTYWSNCSLSLAVSAVLDPRFKMKLVEYYYPQIYGSSAPDYIKDVSDHIKELYNEYAIRSTLDSSDHGLASEVRGSGSGLSSGFFSGTVNDTRDRLKGFDKFLHETSNSQSTNSDLDKYLEEAVFPRNIDFNILNWWKVQKPRFPILSMMAHDVLGMPMSTVPSEFAFYTGGRVLDHYRSSLDPDTIQALICTQDWLQTELEDSKSLSALPALPVHSDTFSMPKIEG